MIQQEDSEIYSDDDEFFHSDHEDLNEVISNVNGDSRKINERYVTNKINHLAIEESKTEEKEDYDEESKEDYDDLSACSYSDFDEYSEDENDPVPYNSNVEAHSNTQSEHLPVSAEPCNCCDPRYEFLKSQICRPITSSQDVSCDRQPRRFSNPDGISAKFGNHRTKGKINFGVVTKSQYDYTRKPKRAQKRIVLSQERINELARPRTAPVRPPDTHKPTQEGETPILKSRSRSRKGEPSALGLDDIIRFTNRMDSRQRSRQKKIDQRIQEKMYQDQTNKKACPVCGNFQSYNEVINKREECPNERCLGAKYVRSRPFSIKKFEERMKFSLTNREKHIALLQQEQENARRNERTLRKSQTQKKLDKNLSRRGPFLTRVEHDLKSRQRKFMNHNNSRSIAQTPHRNSKPQNFKRDQRSDARSREEEKCGY